jgi:diguanylate cyclase (GGDEF)-like protein
MESLINILSAFDSRTTALLVAIAFFIQAFAIGAQAFLIREYKGVGTALLGNVSLVVGFALLLFRNILPDFLTIIIANTLTIASPVLYYISISRFLGQKHSNAFVISILTIMALLLVFFRYITDNVGMRIITASLSGTLFVVAIAYKFWKARHFPYRFSMGLTIIPFITYGILFVIRSVATILSPPKTVFANTPVESATYLLLFIISFFWTIGFILMVSQRLQIDLTELATIDSLTRLSNRYATQIFFEKEISRAQRNKSKFSILLMDLDNFKQINDKYGHAIGDFVLIKTAQVFLSAIREQDVVGRWGGEEFLIILPDTTIENAKIFAERLRTEISATEFKDSSISVKITLSLGIASSNISESMDVILKKADDALYMAKTTKDTIVMAK